MRHFPDDDEVSCSLIKQCICKTVQSNGTSECVLNSRNENNVHKLVIGSQKAEGRKGPMNGWTLFYRRRRRGGDDFKITIQSNY